MSYINNGNYLQLTAFLFHTDELHCIYEANNTMELPCDLKRKSFYKCKYLIIIETLSKNRKSMLSAHYCNVLFAP